MSVMEDAPCVTQLSATRPTARKQYPCDLCNKPIMPGTQYNKNVYRDDDKGGAIVTHRYHRFACYMD